MTEILTPVGRMVQGDPFKSRNTNMEGKPLVNQKGEPRVEYFFAIAIPKTDPGWPAVHQVIQAEAQAGFPGGQFNLPTFSWKIVDGDLPANTQKEGFPGNWVLRCSSGWASKIYIRVNDKVVETVNPEELKRGYYIRAYLNITPNGSSTKPGVYLNPELVERVGFGQEIQSGPDGAQVFGGAPVAQLPPGASATPLANVTPISPGAPPVAAAPPPVGVVPPPVAAVPPPVGVVPPPVVAVPPPVTPPAVVHQMTAKAGGATYEQMIAQNWTDALLLEHGMMLNTSPGVQPAPSILNGQ